MKQDSDFTNSELIEKYLQGELTGEELRNFENRLKEDTEFRKEVEIQQLFVLGVENSALRQSLDSIHQNFYPASNVSFFQSSWINILAGGGFGFIIAVAFIFSLGNGGSKPGPALTDSVSISGTEIISGPGQNDQKADSGVVGYLRKEYPAPILPSQRRNYITRFPGIGISSTLFTLNSLKDTVITGQKGTKIAIPKNCFLYEEGKDIPSQYSFELREVYNTSELIMNDLTGDLDQEARESNGAVYMNARDHQRALVFAPDKKINVQFKDDKDPKTGKVMTSEKQNVIYYKIFDDQPESRLIALPNDVLDYELNYVSKVNDDANYTITYTGRSMNEKIESLLEEKYWNTYISSIPFHYRIEGCMLYSENTDLLDIYLKNIHLKLWQVDSMVAEYLRSKALHDCRNYARYMKAEEYFRWLKSHKCGTVTKIDRLTDRNYHKGQFYNNIPNNKEIGRLQKWGLTRDEAFNMLEFFKKIYVFKSKFFEAKEKNSPLDYYYINEGRYVSYEITDCGQAGKNSMELSSFLSVNKFGWVNYEKFTDKEKSSPLKVKFLTGDTTLPVKIYLVFKEMNYVMGGTWTKEGYNYFPHVPEGATIHVFGLSYGDERIWFGQKKITAGKSDETDLTLEVVSEGEIKKTLSGLD